MILFKTSAASGVWFVCRCASPDLTVRIRTDGIKPNGMSYKKASIREITP